MSQYLLKCGTVYKSRT